MLIHVAAIMVQLTSLCLVCPTLFWFRWDRDCLPLWISRRHLPCEPGGFIIVLDGENKYI